MSKSPQNTFRRDDRNHYTHLMERVALGRVHMDMPSYNLSRYDQHLHSLVRSFLAEIKRIKEVPRGKPTP